MFVKNRQCSKCSRSIEKYSEVSRCLLANFLTIKKMLICICPMLKRKKVVRPNSSTVEVNSNIASSRSNHSTSPSASDMVDKSLAVLSKCVYIYKAASLSFTF